METMPKPAAAAGRRERAAQRTAVVAPAAGQEVLQAGHRGRFTGRLQGLGRRGHTQCCQRGHIGQARDGPGPGATKPRRRRQQRRVHALRPASGPTLACAQATHHAGLRLLVPRHALGAAPAADRDVTRVTPARAGFFVAQQVLERPLVAQLLQHRRHFAHAHQQRQAARCQFTPHVSQALQRELQVAGVRPVR